MRTLLKVNGAKLHLIKGILVLALLAPGLGHADLGDPVLEDNSGPAPYKSYFLPALEIPVFLWLLNRVDRELYGKAVYGTSWKSGRQHVLHGPWKFDTDPFGMNMILHPYLGVITYGFARSAGLNYWESFCYTFVGSFIWETFGETGPPSTNDQIMTGVGGTFLGESLFRMANLVLDSGDKPGHWRELGAAGLVPSAGFNRLVFGKRYNKVWVHNDPAIFTRLRLGGSLTSHLKDQGAVSKSHRAEATGDFSLTYGLPGKSGYSFDRPFDHFNFEFTAVARSGNSFENIMTRGLLYGTKYSLGRNYRGVWGLYGSYDFISPEVFRVSSTALSIGTTAQWWPFRTVALQGSALGGVGFGAAGTIASVGGPIEGERDYHFGVSPQGLLSLRLIVGEGIMLDMTGREYYISGLGSDNSYGSERIFRGIASFTVRVFDRHAIGIQYVESRRNAYYRNLRDRHQLAGTISMVYNFLGDTKFGAVEWRDL